MRALRGFGTTLRCGVEELALVAGYGLAAIILAASQHFFASPTPRASSTSTP
jgi:hypothetical protein